MMMRWKAGLASCACFLAFVLRSPPAEADCFNFVVNGALRGAESGNCTPGLYAEQSPRGGSPMAYAETSSDGKFTLATDGTGSRLRQKDLWVVCRPKASTRSACTAHQLAATNYSLQRNDLTVANVEMICDPLVGAAPAKMAKALAALAETHAVLVWAGAEKLDAADAALKSAVARADAALNPDERERFKVALAAAATPLRVGSRRGLPLLPSLKRDDFAKELIAAAPGRRWLTRPEKNDQVPAPYGERDGRFEGNVAHRVGSTFGDSLVSLSEGPLSVDPQTQASLELTWPASADPRVCLEANPIVPRIGWKMRAAAAAGSASFTWDLSAARRAGMKRDTIGIVARSCADADRERPRYIPVRAVTAASKETAYRLVFLFPRQLTAIELTVFQGDGASQRKIALPKGAVKFDPDAEAPTVTIDVPTSNLDPGPVHLEMSGSGPGGFDPERLTFLHSQRAGRSKK